MFITSFIGPTLLLLVHTFPRDKFTFPLKYFIPLLSLMLSSAVASLLPLVFTSIEYPLGEPVPTPGPGMIVFLIDFVGMFVLSFILLLVKYRRAYGTDRNMLKTFFWGVTITFSSMALSTVLFVVILKTSAFVFLGPIFPVILMAAIAYSIVRYNMFNIKVIGTQMLIVSIWVFLFVRLFVTDNIMTLVVDGLVLLFALVFGILLVKSVKQEVKQREQLEDLTNRLKHANSRLRELDNMKSEFLSFAAHQLRSPLTAIRGYSSMILEGSYGKPAKRLKESVEKIFTASTSLVRVVEDFLNITRIEQGRIKFTFQRMDLRNVVEEIMAEQIPVVKQAKLDLDLLADEETDFMISGDQDKVKQVVGNLVDNAIKYTKKGAITISLEKDKLENKVQLSINDTGIGIPPEVLPELFTKFKRGTSAAKVNIRGTGLGLYIAKEIMKAHHGHIWAKSDGEDKGSTFVLEFPSNMIVGS